MDNSSKNNIKESVLHKIAQKEVVMQPKIFFVFRWIGIVGVALLTLFLSVVAMSFATYSIHESGELFLLGFGTRGVLTFFILFPWLLILLTFVSIIFLEWLIRGVTTAYRIPVLNLFAGFIVLSVIVGVGITSTSFHNTISEYAERNNHEFLRSWYEGLYREDEEHGEFKGIVVSVSEGSFVVGHNDSDNDEDDGLRTVIPLKDLKDVKVEVGDEVYIAGDKDGDTIYAYGIGILR